MTATVVTSENAAEFYAAKSGPVIESTVVAPEAEPVVDESSEEGEEAEGEAKQQEPQKPSNPKIDKRIQVITKQHYAAQEELAAERAAKAALEARVQEMEAKLNPPAKVESDEKPKPSQFTDAFEYAEALAEWAGENALRTRDKQQAEERAAKERDNVVKAWTDRQKAVEAELPDYAETIAESEVKVSDQVRDAILESDAGPKILYHLAKNPEIAEALASKTARQALVEIGRLEAKLSGDTPPAIAKPVGNPSRAPAPITPIKATKAMESPIGSDGEFHGSYAAWKEARRAGKIK